jgi:hypothetical protein
MRKLLWVLFIIIVLLLIAWFSRTKLAAYFLNRHLHVPVTVETFDFTHNEANIRRLWIGNPTGSKTRTSFNTEILNIDASFIEMFSIPLIIEEIYLKNIYIGIENYSKNKGDNNWAKMTQKDNPSSQPMRTYLIKKLILENLTINVTEADGTSKTYPTVAKMEFKDISSESGMPISEIEKEIFKLVMKELIKKYSIELFKSIEPTQVINNPKDPTKWFGK